MKFGKLKICLLPLKGWREASDGRTYTIVTFDVSVSCDGIEVSSDRLLVNKVTWLHGGLVRYITIVVVKDLCVSGYTIPEDWCGVSLSWTFSDLLKVRTGPSSFLTLGPGPQVRSIGASQTSKSGPGSDPTETRPILNVADAVKWWSVSVLDPLISVLTNSSRLSKEYLLFHAPPVSVLCTGSINIRILTSDGRFP